jgi:glucan-binding YG repeat protein
MVTRTIERGRSLAAGAALALGLVLACLLGTAVQAQAAPVPDDGALPAIEEVQATGRIVIDEPAAPVPAAPEAVAPAEEPAAVVAEPAAPAEEPAPVAAPDEPAVDDVQATGKVIVAEPAAPVADEPTVASEPAAPAEEATEATEEPTPIETFATPAKNKWVQESWGTWYYYGADGAPFTGLRQIDKKFYYFASYGGMQSGHININGYWYYFTAPKSKPDAKAPALANGLKRFSIYDYKMNIYKNGKQVELKYSDGSYGLFDVQGRMKTGLQKVGKGSKAKYYYFGSDGYMRAGTYIVKGKLRQFVDTSVYRNGTAPMVTKLTRAPYYTLGTKQDATSVKRYSWYLSAATGEVYSGWKTIAGKRYFFVDGSMQSGLQEINGQYYYFRGGLNTADGKAPLATGMFRTLYAGWDPVHTTDVKTYYQWHWSNPGGTVGSGWLTQGSNRYYLSIYGEMVSGLREINGKYYYFNEQNYEKGGKTPLVTKLTRVKTMYFNSSRNRYMPTYTWHYSHADGTVGSGWLTQGSQRYYFYPAGTMATGLQEIVGNWYYFNPEKVETGGMAPLVTKLTKVTLKYWDTTKKRYVTDVSWHNANPNGTVKIGAQTIKGKRYYFDSIGRMVSGWREVEGQMHYYYLNEDTGLATELRNGIKVIYEDDYYSGKMVSHKYYFDKNGVNKGGWKQDAKKNWYYFGSYYYGGFRAYTDGTWWINGKDYTFDTAGRLVNPKRP